MLLINSQRQLLVITLIGVAFSKPLPACSINEFESSGKTIYDSSGTQPPPPTVPRRRFLPFIPKSPFLPLQRSGNVAHQNFSKAAEPASATQQASPQAGNEQLNANTEMSLGQETMEVRQPGESVPATVTTQGNPAPFSRTNSLLPLSSENGALPINPGEQTYSVRLPLATPGSVLPKIYSPAPAAPPANTFLPNTKQIQTTEYKRPVAWRATAEAVRNQPAGAGLIVKTVNADFKTIYNSALQEVQSSGWNVVSDSIPAGHMLFKIPKQGDPDDAAAWIILVASPIESGATEVRLKIQSKRPSVFTPQVSDFMQRLELRATGNKLL